MLLKTLSLAAVFCLLFSMTVGETVPMTKELNEYVLDVIDDYNGELPYLLNTDYINYNGVTADIVYREKTLLKAHPSGNRASHCVGITFEVFFRAMQLRNQDLAITDDGLNGMTAEELFDFILSWYAAKNNKARYNLASAIEDYGLGKRIEAWEAEPGDFIDFSRANGTAHAVIFLEWLRSEGEIIGLRYWSSQAASEGIAIRDEYFQPVLAWAQAQSPVLPQTMYVARVVGVSDYRAFRVPRREQSVGITATIEQEERD